MIKSILFGIALGIALFTGLLFAISSLTPNSQVRLKLHIPAPIKH